MPKAVVKPAAAFIPAVAEARACAASLAPPPHTRLLSRFHANAGTSQRRAGKKSDPKEEEDTDFAGQDFEAALRQVAAEDEARLAADAWTGPVTKKLQERAKDEEKDEEEEGGEAAGEMVTPAW